MIDVAGLINRISDEVGDWDIRDTADVFICPRIYTRHAGVVITMEEFRALLDTADRALELSGTANVEDVAQPTSPEAT